MRFRASHACANNPRHMHRFANRISINFCCHPDLVGELMSGGDEWFGNHLKGLLLDAASPLFAHAQSLEVRALYLSDGVCSVDVFLFNPQWSSAAITLYPELKDTLPTGIRKAIDDIRAVMERWKIVGCGLDTSYIGAVAPASKDASLRVEWVNRPLPPRSRSVLSTYGAITVEDTSDPVFRTLRGL